ncbi:hypothetical protein ABBQ38_000918 [Trebouxia sp. C0009 RCD-2024]
MFLVKHIASWIALKQNRPFRYLFPASTATAGIDQLRMPCKYPSPAGESRLPQGCSPAGRLGVQGASPSSPSPTATTVTLADLGCWSPAEQPTPTTVTASQLSVGCSDRAPYVGTVPYMASPLGPAVTTGSGFQAEEGRVQGISSDSPSESGTTITLSHLGCWSPPEQPTSTQALAYMPSSTSPTSSLVTASQVGVQGVRSGSPADSASTITLADLLPTEQPTPTPFDDGQCRVPSIDALPSPASPAVISAGQVKASKSTAGKGGSGVTNRRPFRNLNNVQANGTACAQSPCGSAATSFTFAKRRHETTHQHDGMPSPSFRLTSPNATLTPRSLIEDLNDSVPSAIIISTPTESTYATGSASSPVLRSSPASGGDDSSSQLTFAPFLASNSSPDTHSPASPGLTPRDCDSSSTSTSAVGLAGLCTPPSPRINLKKVITRSHVQRQQWGYSDASSSSNSSQAGTSPAASSPAASTPQLAKTRNKKLVTCSRTLRTYWMYTDESSSSSSGDASPSWPSPVPSLSSPTAATPTTWQQLFTDGSDCDSDTSGCTPSPASSCGSGATASQCALPFSQPAELHFISPSPVIQPPQPLRVFLLAPVPSTQSDPGSMGKQQLISPSVCPCSIGRRAFSPVDGTSLSLIDLSSQALSLNALPQAVGSTDSLAAAHPTPLRDASSLKASSTGEVSFLFPGLPTLGTPDALVEANLLDEDRHSAPPSPRLTPATVLSPTQPLYLPARLTIPAGSTGVTRLAHSRSPGSSSSQLTFAPFMASSGLHTRSPTTPGLSPFYLDSSIDTPGAAGLASSCTTTTAKIVPNKRVITRTHVQRRQWGDSDASSSDGEASPAETFPVSSTPQPARVRSKHLVTCSRTPHKYWVYSSDSSSSSSGGDASPSWPSPVPSSHSPTAATPASRSSPLHLSRGTDTFNPSTAIPWTATSPVSCFRQWINTLQSPAAVSPNSGKTSSVALPRSRGATLPHGVASPSGSAASKVATQRAVPAAAAAAATPTSTPVSPPTSTSVSSVCRVELIGQDASAGLPSTSTMPCPTAGTVMAVAVKAGATPGVAQARNCSVQTRGAVPSPCASQQPRRMSSDQAIVQSAARPAAPKLPGFPGSRGTGARKAAMTATATRAAASGVVTRSRAAAAAAKIPPVEAAAQTDPRPAIAPSQRNQSSLKTEAPTRVQPKRVAKRAWR